MTVLTLDIIKHNGVTPADDMAPQINTDCRNFTLDFNHFCTFYSTLFPSTLLYINVLWCSTLRTSNFFCNLLLRLSLLVEGVNDGFLHYCQVSSLPQHCEFY